MKITEYAVKSRVATLAIAAAMIVLGIYGYISLPVDFLPDLQYPMVRVNIQWRGATAEQIERNIAEPVERNVATIDNLDYITSTSMEGLYSLEINLRYGADLDSGYQDVLAAVERSIRRLPDDIDPPNIFKADPTQLPVLRLAVGSENMDMVELRAWAEDYLQDEILAVRGVAGTEVEGGLQREIRVVIDPASLSKHNLSVSGILSRLRAENVDRFAGRVYEGRRELVARTDAEFTDPDEIGALILLKTGHSAVRIRDVAQVVDGHEQQRVIARLNGRDSVRLSVYKQAEANTVQVAGDVGARISRLRETLPDDIELQIIEDQAVYVQSELSGVRDAAIGAGILVVLVIYIFLGSFVHVAIMLAALTVTLILNFAFMHLAGFSLNVFSLGGLVIAMGVVVDNSIVVIENITRLRREKPDAGARSVALEATREVGPALTAATVSLVALCVPVLIVPATASLLFRELVMIIVGIVIISLAVAVTLTPMFGALLHVPDSENMARGGPKAWFSAFFENIKDIYAGLLGRLMALRYAVIAAFCIVLVLAVSLLPRLGSEFLPSVDDGRLTVMVNLPAGTALNVTDEVVRSAERIVAGQEHVESYFSIAGGRQRGMRLQEESHRGTVDVQLVPRLDRDISTEYFIRSLRQELRRVNAPGGQVTARQARIRGLRQRGEGQIDVMVRGRETVTLIEIAREVRQKMGQVPGLSNVRFDMDAGRPEYRIVIDRERAADRGITAVQLADTVQTLMEGSAPVQFRDGTQYYDIRVMMPERSVSSPGELQNLRVDLPGGGSVPLLDMVSVERSEGPVEIIRENQVKQVIVTSELAEGTVGGVLSELRSAMGEIELPPGYELSYGGQAQMLAETTRALLAIMGFAVFFAFTVLAVQFNSLRMPLLVLSCVPFSLAGMAIILYLTGLPMGATVIIGILIVLAATINDGVLVLTYAEQRRGEGIGPVEAVVDAAAVRLRPRLMTTLTTVAGFTTLAADLTGGGDMLQPMAVAAIGGLAMEIVVALFFLPCLYAIAPSRFFHF